MKKFLFVLSLSCLLLVSCNQKEKKAGEMLQQLKAAVDSKNMETIKSLYPAVTDADSLVTDFIIDSFKYEVVNDTLVANDDSGHAFYFFGEDDKDLKIVNSKGIFCYPDYKMKFAKGTGQYKEGLLDVELSKRMNDNSFADYILQKLRAKYSNPLSTGESVITSDLIDNATGAEGYVPVTNHSDIMLEGTDYDFRYNIDYFYPDEQGTEKKSMKGKTIGPGETIRMPIWYNEHNLPHGYQIIYHISDATLMDAFKPVGNEYDEYLKANDGVPGGVENTTLKGHRTFSGSMDNYKINGTLDFSDGNSFTGEYGYKGRTTGLSIQGTLMADGTVTAIETNSKGNSSGNYLGKVHGTTITGRFTNYKGEQFTFEWNIK